ncbi:MAG: histidine kinase, partial [Bacteroidota bacterium]
TILAQEEERTRIARELHDDIGSKLSVMSMFVKQLGSVMPAGETELVEEIDGMIMKSMDTTRRISHELLPPTLQKFGLVSALTELAEGYEKTGTSLNMKLDPLESISLDDKATLNLFRIVQELSKNSIQHGEASEIKLEFKASEGQGGMSYQDNGKGVNKTVLINGKGLGISNIDSRVK